MTKYTFTAVYFVVNFVTMSLLYFFGRNFYFIFLFFSKLPIFLKFSNCRIITDQTTNFENIQYDKSYFYYNLFATKLVTINLLPLQDRYSHFNFFFQKCQYFSNFQIAAQLQPRLIILKTSIKTKYTFTAVQFAV